MKKYKLADGTIFESIFSIEKEDIDKLSKLDPELRPEYIGMLISKYLKKASK